jgi:anti-sigma factor RsiW
VSDKRDKDTLPGSGHCGEDVAAYALGALEPAEGEAFARHLESCAVCRDELEAFQQVIDVLPMTAPAFKAPPKLRRSLRRAIADQPHPAAGKASRSRQPRRSWRPRWLPRPVLGVAAGLAVIAIALVIVLGGGGSSTRVVQAQVTGHGSASLKISGHRAELVVQHVAAPPSGKIYEVWLVHGQRAPQPTNALFDVNADGDGDVDVPGSLKGVSQVLVTPEPAGGSKVPTHSPVIAAKLS